MRPALAATLAVVLLAGGCGASPSAPAVDAGSHISLDGPEAGQLISDAACSCGSLGRPAQSGTCTFSIPCPEGDFLHLELINGSGFAIPRDASHANGWDYTDASRLTVEIYGPTCDDILGGAQVTITYGC